MNDVQYLIDRQLGIASSYGYDNVLKRLVVREGDAFHALGVAGAEDPPIFACRFAETPGFEHILALANEDGRVAIQNIKKHGSASSLESFQCHNNAVFDLVWTPGQMSFVTVSGDHTACLWDLAGGGGEPQRVAVFAQHTRSVKTAAFSPTDNTVFATGARDGHVLVWDVRMGNSPALVVRPDNCLLSAHGGGTPRTPGSRRRSPAPAPHAALRPVSITGLVFQDDRTLISCAECDGNIKVWDLRKNYSAMTRVPLPARAIPYCGASPRRGYSCVALDRARRRLYASAMDHVIYCFDVAASSPHPHPERRYLGHENASFYIKTCVSPDGRYLASGSSDTRAYLWDTRRTHPAACLAAHRAEVTCVAWAAAPAPTLATCGDDARHMLWRVGTEREEPDLLRGRAEPAPLPPHAYESLRVATPGTPAALKRRAHSPAGESTSGKRPRPRASAPPGKTKRCLAALLDAAPGPSSPRPAPPLPPEDAHSPPPAKRRPLSPRDCNTPPPPPPPPPLTPSPPRARVARFTTALPDFVRDGEAPHLRLMSPHKRKPDAPDWLTLLARSKRPRAAPAPAPAPAAERAPTPPPPPRRPSGEKTPKAKTKTLLKYFSLASKENV